MPRDKPNQGNKKKFYNENFTTEKTEIKEDERRLKSFHAHG